MTTADPKNVPAFPISAPGRRGLPRDWVAALAGKTP